jgi:DNA-binding response OmpR family regulator
LREALEAEGIVALEAADKAALFRNLETEPVDLITLDLSLGHEDGLDLARQIRIMRNIPIVMITGRGAPIDRVTGLEHGADDYISKPFHIREVLLRIHNVLRRYKREEGMPKPREARRYAFERGVLIPRSGGQETDGTVLDLTDREFDLLELFLKHPARVLSRDEILQSVQGRQWSPLIGR